MAQFFYSKTVANSILFVGKTWNFTKKDSIIDLTLLVKYIKACLDIIIKTSKYWLLYYQLWKNVFVCWDKFGSHRNSSPELLFKKRICQKFLKICKKIPWLESLFLKIRLTEKKGNSSTDVFPRIVPIFFRTIPGAVF